MAEESTLVAETGGGESAAPGMEAEPDRDDRPNRPENAAGDQERAQDPTAATASGTDPVEDLTVRGGKPGNRQEPAKAKEPTKAKQKAAEQVATVVNNFYAGVDAQNGTFGLQDGAGERRMGGKAPLTGKISVTEVRAMVSGYARPTCFDDALRKLRDLRVIVIEGRADTGRRAGAINLLHEVTTDKLIVLSPVQTLRQLAERDYTEGLGYLVLDRVRDTNTADLEFTWSNVRDKVQEAGAYLVITSAHVGTSNASAAVPHVPWECPPPGDLLRTRLDGLANLETVVPELLAGLPERCPPARLVSLAQLVGEDKLPPTDALKRLDENAARDVQEWFAREPGHREVVEVAALCFLSGVDVRTFETLLRDLHDAMARRATGRRARANLNRQDLDTFGERGVRTEGGGLIGHHDEVTSDAGTVRVVVFKDRAYTRCVLEELWRVCSVPFWDAIREWLADLVERSARAPGVMTRVASGLAWLACSSYPEVESSYLIPWAEARIGWPGQVTASYVLWYMCHREGLAPLALQTAIRWAQSRDMEVRATAGLSFGGELGMCFPVEATNRLWQLASQKLEFWEIALNSLAELFAALNDNEQGEPAVILNHLRKKMALFGTANGRPNKRMPADQLLWLRTLTMTSCLSVLDVNSTRTPYPAIFDYLYHHEDQVAVVAELWAGVIIFRPLRWEAFKTLRRGLHTLRDIGSDPTRIARLFGAALSEALPLRERALFKDEFMEADARLRRGQKKSPSDVLLACLEAIAVKSDTGGIR